MIGPVLSGATGLARSTTGGSGDTIDYYGVRAEGAEDNVYEGKNMVVIGDSIVAGFTIADTSDRWSTLLATLLSSTEVNHGVNSSTMEKQTPVDPLGGQNLQDRFSQIPTYSTSYGLLIGAAVINDFGINEANYNPTNYKSDTLLWLADAYGKGWPHEKILLVGPSYLPDDGFVHYGGVSGNPDPNRTQLLAFKDVFEVLAEEEGINIYQPYDHAVAVVEDPATLVGGDFIHPTETYHALIANGIHNLLTH
jgi:hypothetical protein